MRHKVSKFKKLCEVTWMAFAMSVVVVGLGVEKVVKKLKK